MPKRSNEFQKLIYAINQALADDPFSSVSESEELIDQITGKPREVDIVVRSVAHGVAVVVGIECTSRKRKVTTQWVEGLISKHSKLETSHLILVSYSGFTGPASELIEKTNCVEAIAFGEALDADWLQKISDETVNIMQLCFEVLDVDFLGSLIEGNPSDRVLLDARVSHCDECDRGSSELMDYCTNVLNEHSCWQPPTLEALVKDDPELNERFILMALESEKGIFEQITGGKDKNVGVITLTSDQANFLISRGDEVYLQSVVLMCTLKVQVAKSEDIQLINGTFLGKEVAFRTIRTPDHRCKGFAIAIHADDDDKRTVKFEELDD